MLHELHMPLFLGSPHLDAPWMLTNRLDIIRASCTGFTLDVQPTGWQSSRHPKQDSPWTSSLLARYWPDILNRIHPEHLACNYPHHPCVHILNMPKMRRCLAWSPCCLLHPVSPTPGCTLVLKHLAGCLYDIGHLAFISHPQLPTALTMVPCQSLNRLRPGRMI